ncbi:MAG: hypothetical protein SFU86_05765 [Pirellulaceae bacterium]|nr:hypothetical protein [Pirellulaceae bacterium]
MKLAFIPAAALVLSLAGLASAQTYGPSAAPVVGGSPIGFYPNEDYGYFSSTYEEGVLRGLGYYARSVGQANYYHSLASINHQEAYSRYLDNREKRTETYFRLKQINRAARDAQKPSRMTGEQYAVLAKRQAPDRLTGSEYDRALGRLEWPAALQGPEFAAERTALDRVFATRAPNDSGVGSKFSVTVRQLTGPMQDRLQASVSSLSPMQFIAAKKFLTGLAYEAQQPVLPAGLAVVK